MSTPYVIEVPERGRSANLPSAMWSDLSGNDAFWRLVEHRRIKVLPRARNQVRLEGTSFVGRALIGDVRLEVTEKIGGALAALLKFATHDAFRIELAEAPISELGDLAALLVRQFLLAVRRYVSEGRDFRYSTQGAVGSLVGGRIDIIKTISLRARGMRHLVAFDRNVIDRRTPKNRVSLAALRETENLSALINLSRDDVATARGLSVLFDDCRDPGVVFGKREDMARLAQSLADSREERRHRDMLTLANVLLSHASFEHADPLPGTVPRAWFLNLETLFETAVRSVLNDLCDPEVKVGKGAEPKPLIFEKRKQRAHPDIVFHREGKAIAVGDVKYKDVGDGDWMRRVKRADSYQLLIHAAAFGSPVCFLVYPHDTFDFRDLGVSVTGCRTFVFTVDVRRLPESLRSAMEEMRLPVRSDLTGYAVPPSGVSPLAADAL